MAKKEKIGVDMSEVARKIGSTLGDAVAQAGRVVEGVKAAAKAGAETYSKKTRTPKRTAAKKTVAKKRAAKKKSARQA